jgi:diketogulonate reductase-like aldo/keto reductase
LHQLTHHLKTLGLDYIDMMIIHSPKPWAKFLEQEPFFEGNREAWRALEEAYKAGKLRAIGLSNFEKADIDNILASCSVSQWSIKFWHTSATHQRADSILSRERHSCRGLFTFWTRRIIQEPGSSSNSRKI